VTQMGLLEKNANGRAPLTANNEAVKLDAKRRSMESQSAACDLGLRRMFQWWFGSLLVA
jgi:hypothetical protein